MNNLAKMGGMKKVGDKGSAPLVIAVATLLVLLALGIGYKKLSSPSVSSSVSDTSQNGTFAPFGQDSINPNAVASSQNNGNADTLDPMYMNRTPSSQNQGAGVQSGSATGNQVVAQGGYSTGSGNGYLAGYSANSAIFPSTYTYNGFYTPPGKVVSFNGTTQTNITNTLGAGGSSTTTGAGSNSYTTTGTHGGSGTSIVTNTTNTSTTSGTTASSGGSSGSGITSYLPPLQVVGVLSGNPVDITNSVMSIGGGSAFGGGSNSGGSSMLGGIIGAGAGALLGGGSSSGGGASGGSQTFSGRVSNVTYCTCSASIMLDIGGSSGGGKKSLIYTPGASQLYATFNIYGTGENVLGTYTSGGTCLVYHGEDCSSQGSPDGTIKMVGTSAM
jgi:hypothetical protein